MRDLSVAQGLSQTLVECLYQDRHGFMWFGTYDGLNRYDGYQFKIFKAGQANGISDNLIFAITGDSLGYIWVGTRHGGLNRYDPFNETFGHFVHDPDNPSSIGDNFVSNLFVDRTGVLWVGTDRGLNRYDGNGKFKRYNRTAEDPRGFSNSRIVDIAEDGSGNLWLGTAEGLVHFDRQKEKFTRFFGSGGPPLFERYRVDAVYVDRRENLWASISIKPLVLRLSKEVWQTLLKTPYPANLKILDNHVVPLEGSQSVGGITEDSLGQVWMSGLEKIHRYDPQSGRIQAFDRESLNGDDLPPSSGSEILFDHTGMMWVGGSFYPHLSGRFALYRKKDNTPGGLRSRSIRTISEDPRSRLWISGYEATDIFDPATGTFTPFTPNGDESFYAFALYADPVTRGQILWMGTDGKGLIGYDHQTGKLSKSMFRSEEETPELYNYITSLWRTSDEALWVGTSTGLHKVVFESPTNPDLNRITVSSFESQSNNPNSLSNNFVWRVYEAPGIPGILWVGTAQGLNLFDTSTGLFTRFFHFSNSDSSISSDAVFDVLQDSKGRIWVATALGLNRVLMPKGEKPTPDNVRFIRYTTEDGLPNDQVYGILEDGQGALWMSTNRGLSCFDPEREIFRNYDAYDGLQNNEFNRNAFFKGKNGTMYFGGINGFNAFMPEGTDQYIPPPKVVLTEFMVFNKSVEVGEKWSAGDDTPILSKSITEAREVHLAYYHTFFSFEFAALDFAAPQKNRFAYKMEGFDRDWVYSGNRRVATYTNLDPGTYIFRVKAANRDGVWNENGVSVRVYVEAPFWKRVWFRLLALLLSGSLIIGAIQYRSYLIQKRNRQLEKEIAERKQAEQELRISEQRFASAFQASPDMIGINAIPHPLLLEVNEAFELGTGYTREEALGKTPLELGLWVNLEDRATYIEILQKEKRVRNFEIQMRVKSGGIRFVLLSAEPITFSGQKGLLFIMKDITERQEAKNALRLSEERFNKAFQASPDVIVITNIPDGQLLEVNQAFENVLGFDREEALGKTVLELNMWPDIRDREKYYEIVRRDGGVRNLEARLRRKDGEIISVLLSAEPVAFDNHACMLTIVKDITERHKSRLALEEANRELQALKERLEAENVYLQEEIRLEHNFEEIVGNSKAIRDVLVRIEQVAGADTTVLITGETGTGKELVARAIHNLSPRSGRTLVKVNCASLPANLIESELFGHEKGAFTGANARRLGKFELASGGSLFLDEIGELPIELQAKILRALQENEIERIGGEKPIRVDVRVIAATNRDLSREIAENRFREDLYYRLNVFPIALPPLRERKEDLSQLIHHFISKYNPKLGKSVVQIAAPALEALKNYPWPGNIRELENVIERALISCRSETLTLRELDLEQTAGEAHLHLDGTLEEVERTYIISVLESTNWVIAGDRGAASILGLHKNTLRSRMQKLGIRKPE
ncbi:MAG: sigma 54-interacting transcriptional regulator [Calditrichaeota bacterium]|nr:sigma 54-interacting transcriptional regulator [Calditrichota bacterium]